MPRAMPEIPPGPWTEDDVASIDESNDDVQLMDGSLWITSLPNGPHQEITARLCAMLLPPADEAGLRVLQSVRVRLAPNVTVRPDLIIESGARVVTMVDASDVRLVAEIVTLGTEFLDHELKTRLYAEAKIKWYLLVEPDLTNYESVKVRLLRLGAKGYETYAIAQHHETLTLGAPIHVTVNPKKLLRL